MPRTTAISDQRTNGHRGEGHYATGISRSDALVLAIITVLAAVLRILYLTSKSLTLDEGFSLFMATTDFGTFRRFLASGEINMALYYWLLRLWLHLGRGEFVVRSLSVLPAVATIPVVYAIGRRLAGRRVGQFAALLLAVQPMHVAFAQELRSYAWAVLLVSVSSLLFLRAVDLPSRRNLAGYALISALAVYAHLFAGLVLLAQWVSLPFQQRARVPWRRLAWSGVLLAVLLAPAVFVAALNVRAQINWIPISTGHDLLEVLYSLTLSKFRCLLYLFLWGAAVWTGIRSQTERSRHAFAWTWLLVPLAITAGMSFYKPLLVPRFLLVCVPASVLLAAAGLLQLNRVIAGILLSLVVLYSIGGNRFYYRHPQLKEDWRGAAGYVLSHSSPGDSVVLLPSYGRFVFGYYRQTAGPAAGAVTERDTSAEIPLTNTGQVWIVTSRIMSPQLGPAEVAAFLARRDDSYRMAEFRDFYGLGVWRLQEQQVRSNGK